MSDLTDYLETQIITHIYRTGTLTLPANLYFGLITAVTDIEAGTVTEATGTGYARVSMVRNGSNFDYTTRIISNLVNITFPSPGASWGTATHWGVWDAASGGNLLMATTLDASKTIGSGDAAPEWAAGAFLFDFSSHSSDYLASALANWIFIGTNYTKPTTLDYALYTVAPTASGGGTEVTGGSYARVTLLPLDANYSAPSGGDGHTDNLSVIQYAAPTANWGAVLAMAVFDQTGMVGFTTFTTLNVNNGDTAPSFPAGQFDFTLG